MLWDKAWWPNKGVEVFNRVSPQGDGAWQEFISLAPITGAPARVRACVIRRPGRRQSPLEVHTA